MRKLWVIEVLIDDKWGPAMFGHSELKIFAQIEAASAWKKTGGKYRVVRYGPVAPPERRD